MKRRDPIGTAIAVLRLLAPDRKLTCREIAEELGDNPESIRRVLWSLYREGAVVRWGTAPLRGGRRGAPAYYWLLPPA